MFYSGSILDYKEYGRHTLTINRLGYGHELIYNLPIVKSCI